ncbi:ROK family transcriptional regulator [Brooklawnia sp.]|uniref:ROK family transcriptional regulator n=1 Tax=Brooklawnia sp. TaxID=2699740 RepID=UPI00311D3C3C
MTPGRPRNPTLRRPSSSARAGATLEGVRAVNLSLVLREILANPGTISRAAIAAHVGITRATVSRLVDELINAGLVHDLSPASDTARGRPGIPLAPRPGAAIGLGLEINISYLSACAIDLTGEILSLETIHGDFAGSAPAQAIGELAELGRTVLNSTRVNSRTGSATFVGSGLALPGLVSSDALALAPNLGWRNLPMTSLLEPIAALDPVVVANEADLAAFAVANPRPGVPDGPPSFIYVSGEVGIGAGIIIDHRPLSGAHGWSGEIGHICVDPAGPVCSCGASGCLEAYLGLRALSRNAGMPAGSTPDEIVAAAHEGSVRAQAAITDGGAALGRALAAIVNTVDIPEIILGGIVAAIGGDLIPAARDELRTRVLQSASSDLEVRIAEDPANLAVIGAAHRALQRLVDDPIVWTA